MWQNPYIDESGTLFFIFAVITAGMFISGAFKKGKGYGALSIVALIGLFFAFVYFPGFRTLAITPFAIFLLVGLVLSFVRDNI